jgi:hypothetical protein
MARAGKALEAYLIAGMSDKKRAPKDRDKMAAMLAKYLNGKRKGKNKVTRVEKMGTAVEGLPRVKGRKAQRNAVATDVALSNEWADLIPKAQVVPIRR